MCCDKYQLQKVIKFTLPTASGAVASFEQLIKGTNSSYPGCSLLIKNVSPTNDLGTSMDNTILYYEATGAVDRNHKNKTKNVAKPL